MKRPLFLSLLEFLSNISLDNVDQDRSCNILINITILLRNNERLSASEKGHVAQSKWFWSCGDAERIAL